MTTFFLKPHTEVFSQCWGMFSIARSNSESISIRYSLTLLRRTWWLHGYKELEVYFKVGDHQIIRNSLNGGFLRFRAKKIGPYQRFLIGQDSLSKGSLYPVFTVTPNRQTSVTGLPSVTATATITSMDPNASKYCSRCVHKLPPSAFFNALRPSKPFSFCVPCRERSRVSNQKRRAQQALDASNGIERPSQRRRTAVAPRVYILLPH